MGQVIIKNFFTQCDHGKGLKCKSCDILYFRKKFQETLLWFAGIFTLLGCLGIWLIK